MDRGFVVFVVIVIAAIAFNLMPEGEELHHAGSLEAESLASLNYACNDTIPTMAGRKFDKLRALLHEHAKYVNFQLHFVLEWKCAPTEP